MQKSILKPVALFASVFFVCMAEISAQKINTIKKEKFHWGSETGQDSTAGYTQALKVDNVIYVSGTVSKSVTPEGVKNLYSALEKTLLHFGATFQNVVKENLYTTDMEAMKEYNAARKVFYKDDFPAATWVQVSRLYMYDARLEVELIAHLPK